MISLENIEKLETFCGTYKNWEEYEEKQDFEPIQNGLIYCEDENKLYIYDMVEGWHSLIVPVDKDIDTGISIHELNKQAMEQIGPIKEGAIKHARSLINQLGKKHKYEYFMLLFKDISYYTIFHYQIDTEQNSEYSSLGTAVIDCLNNIGTIYSIGETNNDSFEIWVKDLSSNELITGFLFPYDLGVVNVYERKK